MEHILFASSTTHLFLNVVERVRAVDGEANENNVRIWVRERPETVIVFLASGIP